MDEIRSRAASSLRFVAIIARIGMVFLSLFVGGVIPRALWRRHFADKTVRAT
jgi:hypothetical protein